MKCELQPSLLPVQLLVLLPLHGPEQMQVQLLVLVQVPEPLLVPVPVRLVVPLLLPEMVLLVELVPVSEQVPVSMPDPPVDQPDPLMRSVPNPLLDQTASADSARATVSARSVAEGGTDVRDRGDRVWSAMISFLT